MPEAGPKRSARSARSGALPPELAAASNVPVSAAADCSVHPLAQAYLNVRVVVLRGAECQRMVPRDVHDLPDQAHFPLSWQLTALCIRLLRHT